jgi:hypothetical protein
MIFPPVVGQLPGAGTPLQAGTPVERSLGPGQSHNYTINLDAGQFLQLVVDQHGIDVIVRVFSPSGKRLGEFDTPNGDEGPENVTVVAIAAGSYRVKLPHWAKWTMPRPDVMKFGSQRSAKPLSRSCRRETTKSS